MDDLERFCLMSRKSFFAYSALFFLILEPALTLLYILGIDDLESQKSINDDLIISALLAAVVLSGLCGFFYYKMIFRPRRVFRERVFILTQKDWLGYAIDDMHCGMLRFKDRVLIGKDSIMGKGLGVVLIYDEISSLYIKMDRYTFEGSKLQRRYLAADAGTHTYHICHLPSDTHFAREWAEMKEYLKQAAPHISVR